MSYEKLIQQDIPYAYYNLDSAGDNRPPLVWEGAGSSLITNQKLTYIFPVYTNRNQPHTIELWFRPLSNDPINIVGHEEGDGFKWSQGTLSYELWIGSQKIVLSYYAGIIQTFYLTVVYNKSSISLHVNGDLKDSHNFVNDEIPLAYFPFTNPNQLVTQGTGSPFILDAVAFYSNSIDSLAEKHYKWAQPNTFIIRNAAIQSAETFELNLSNIETQNVIIDINDALLENLSTADGLTQSKTENGEILQGTWTGLIPTNNYDNTILSYETNLPVNVSYSLDGLSFTNLTNNYVSTKNQDYFILKIVLPAGTPIQLKNIKMTNYANQNLGSHGGSRIVNLIDRPVMNDYFYPTTAISNGVPGVLNISGSETANAVEFWIKDSSSSSITSLSGTKIINNNNGWYPNDWNHVVVTGAVPDTFTVGKTSSLVSIVNVYVNSPDINYLYSSYFGKNVMSISDTSLTTISDSFTHYGYKWSIITA